jgi:hypothetical protein
MHGPGRQVTKRRVVFSPIHDTAGLTGYAIVTCVIESSVQVTVL